MVSAEIVTFRKYFNELRQSNGGFYQNDHPNPYRFFTSLRSYQTKPKAKQHDFLNYTKTFVKKEFVPVLNNLSQKQRLQSARLSKPKYITRPKTLKEL